MIWEMIGVEMVIQVLKDQGVDIIFGYLGGVVFFIYDEIIQQDGFEYILVWYEQGVGYVVEGYVCLIGKLGVVLVIFGLGVINMVIVLIDVMLDSILLVCIFGQVLIYLIGNDVFQECDIVGIICFCIKYNWLVCNVDDLLCILYEVFYVVIFGCLGLVVVDIFKDV